MFMTALNIRQTATAVAAALLGTTTLIAMSASPAHAATQAMSASPAHAATEFQKQVERQIAANPAGVTKRHLGESGVAIVAIRIDAAGSILSTGVARSSGRPALDAEAVATANAVRYPQGPAPRTVAVVITFGGATAPAAARSAAIAQTYVNAKGQALAAETPASPKG